MKIAIPMTGANLNQHFGHSEKFAFIDIDPGSKKITSSTETAAPEHQHGLLPPWLKERGVTHVIAGGMGAHARLLLQEASIEVITGAPSETPAVVVERFLQGTLQTIESSCDHTCNH